MNFSSMLSETTKVPLEGVSEVRMRTTTETNFKDLPKDLLRAAGFKIKTVTPTSFGVEIEFATKYADEDIQDVLADFNIKLKGKSVFIVD